MHKTKSLKGRVYFINSQSNGNFAINSPVLQTSRSSLEAKKNEIKQQPAKLAKKCDKTQDNGLIYIFFFNCSLFWQMIWTKSWRLITYPPSKFEKFFIPDLYFVRMEIAELDSLGNKYFYVILSETSERPKLLISHVWRVFKKSHQF